MQKVTNNMFFFFALLFFQLRGNIIFFWARSYRTPRLNKTFEILTFVRKMNIIKEKNKFPNNWKEMKEKIVFY